MREDQKRFLQKIAHWIPILFEQIRRGNYSSEITLGIRVISDRRIRLLVRVEVIDPGRNPMETHGLHDTRDRVETVEVTVKPRGRRTSRRGRGQRFN